MTNLLKISLLTLLGIFVLTGCAQTKALLAKRDDGSLDYATAKKLPPINLPAHQQTAAFTPIYTVPNLAPPSVISTNEAGKQYRLPTPPKITH